ncbi:hypothetical protein EKO04_009414 [Ascochyta lentis]|uniref:Uncharacterized protein n=1 Tax=Ascochyta lentis TaxID=205686 RepID=A0A8H7IW19_9PLEO|nr:hypothetical protein EKO04_009414 [Ascochyta lentis]
MAFQAEETHADTDSKFFRKQYRLFHATFAQFCYVGGQAAIARTFINYVTEVKGTISSTGARYLAGAQGTFALDRFAGSAMMKFMKPCYIFLVYMTLSVVFLVPTITERGTPGLAVLYLVFFFESIIFPTIVALGIRGLGRHSKRGSGFIVGGVCGGAVVPPRLFIASDSQKP